MGLKVQSLDELDPTLVQQAQSTLIQLMLERHPEADLADGILNDLVAYMAGGISGAINQTEVNRVQQAGSLLAISENPQLADDTLVDLKLSDYFITRKPGVSATGELTLVVTDNTSVVIPNNAVFTANGVDFVADAPYIGRPAGSVLQSDNERYLSPRPDGTYEFTFSITAAIPGVAGNIRRGSKFVPQTVIGRYVTSYAATDFSGGTNTEVNAELIARLQEGIAAKVFQGRTNITALIHEQPQFENTVGYSIIGIGNPEMLRDKHGIIPIGSGGRVDIYSRTAPLPLHLSIKKTATLTQKLGAGSLWQVALQRNDAPGFYEVDHVIRADDPPDATGFAVTFDLRGTDLSGSGFIPDIVNAVEAAFTAFQTGVIRFIDDVTDVTEMEVGDTADYVLITTAMPLISELQTFASAPQHRNMAGDNLIKAPVPCFLSVDLDIEQAAGETAPDLDAIRNDIAAMVNALDFPGQLHSSMIADVVQNYLTRRQGVSPIDMSGRIRRPDGKMLHVRSNQILQLPDSPSTMTTGRTIAMFLDPADVGLSIVTKGFEAGI